MYEITIKKIQKEMIKSKEWKVIGQLSKEEADEKNKGLHNPTYKVGDDKYGYVVEIEEEKDIEKEIYSQRLEDIDIDAIIKAVNQI